MHLVFLGNDLICMTRIVSMTVSNKLKLDLVCLCDVDLLKYFLCIVELLSKMK